MENFSSPVPYLTFMLGGEYFACRIEEVVEVIDMQKVTSVPKTPPHICGVINFRGDILPLIDIRKVCSSDGHAANGADTQTESPAEDSGISKESVIIVLEISGGEEDGDTLTAGALADCVNDVVEIKPVDIVPIPEFDTKIKPEYTEGLFKYNGAFVTVLNMPAVFSLDKN